MKATQKAVSRDVVSIEAIVAALYDTISGPAGKARDWNRLRSLFYPGARLLRTVMAGDGAVSMDARDVEAFIAMADPHCQAHDFHERELFRRVDQFGHAAQVLSTYAASAAPDGSHPLGRGINCIQLWFDGRRWWVMSLLWDDERPGQSIPTQYLP